LKSQQHIYRRNKYQHLGIELNENRIRLQRIIVGIMVLFLFFPMNIVIFKGESSTIESNINNISTKESGIPYNEWSMLRGDSNHTGNATCIGPSSGNHLWKTIQRSNMFSSPTVKYGHVYIGRGELIYCYDIYNGSTVWSYNLSYLTQSSPLVFGGRVYIGGGSKLFCLDANGTGGNTTKYWTAQIGGIVYSSPTTDGDDDIFIASGNGLLKAIYTNGTEHWSSSINGGAASSPAYWNGRVYCGGGSWAGGDHSIYCFNADSGEQIWYRTLDSPVCSSPALAYGNVYIAGSGDVGGVGEFGNIYCLDAMGSGGTTTVIWKHNIGGAYSSPAVGYGRVYIGSNTGRFYCLDAFGNGTGETTQYWSRKFNDWSHCSPIITPKYVYTGAGDGQFFCLNRTDSSIVWSRAHGTRDGPWGISASPALAGNLIFMTNDGDRLYCIGAKKDTEPPKILNTVPASDAMEVNVDIEIKIRFHKPVILSSISETSIVLKDSKGQTVSGSVRSNMVGDTAYFKPNKSLKKNELFTVTVTTDIVDLVGFHLDGDKNGKSEGAGIDEYSFSFTTVPPYPPYIGPIPTQRPTEDSLFVVNLSSNITDPDTPKENLILEVNSSYITVEGLELRMMYPNGVNFEQVNVSVYDGQLFDNITLIVQVYPVNDPPSLSNPQVTPEEGDTRTEFVFSVVFTDVDIDERNPLVQLVIGEEKYPCIKASGDYHKGTTFKFNKTLPKGEHTFHFTADDHGGGEAFTEGMNITVAPEKSGNDKEGSSIGLVVGAILAVVVIMLLAMVKKKKKQQTGDMKNTGEHDSSEMETQK
jgi:outer membrane protein assembly factor BamB